jgi:RsiW-degrading membrane proteinase PrsW (M82 family)
VSLGFAFVEDFLYGYADLGVLLLRAFTAVPLHAVASGVMGYYVGIEKIEGRRGAAETGASGKGGAGKGLAEGGGLATRAGARPWAAKASRRGLAWAVLIHGLYDFFLLTRSLTGLLVIPLLVVGWRILSRLYRRAQSEDERDARLPPYQSRAAPIL